MTESCIDILPRIGKLVYFSEVTVIRLLSYQLG